MGCSPLRYPAYEKSGRRPLGCHFSPLLPQSSETCGRNGAGRTRSGAAWRSVAHPETASSSSEATPTIQICLSISFEPPPNPSERRSKTIQIATFFQCHFFSSSSSDCLFSLKLKKKEKNPIFFSACLVVDCIQRKT